MQYGGTPDYSSTRSLQGGEVGAADDLESLGYTFLELFTGKELPWNGAASPYHRHSLFLQHIKLLFISVFITTQPPLLLQ